MNIANGTKTYKQTEHLVYSCQYHVIFCPKYRRKILKNGLDDFVKQTFLDISTKHDFSILEMEIMPDHVHLLIDCNPRYGIMNCIKVLKRYYTPEMIKFDPTLKSRLPSIWTRSAFVSSVGSVSLEVVRKYIENQKGK